MAANTEQKTQVNTESTHVGTSFTRGPEDGEMAVVVEFEQLAFVDSTNTQLTLDSRDKRRTLEKSTSQGFNSLQCVNISGLRLTLIRQFKLTWDNFFSPSMASWRRRIQTYSLPAPCWDLTKRVALSTQTIKPPVTLGSRVPEWPVFSTRRIRLIQATTSWDEGLAG